MTFTKPQKRLLVIAVVIATLALAIIAIVTAIRIQQIGTQPVAPSIPKSKPEAQGVIPTPGAGSDCRKTYQIAQGPTLTPTPTPTSGPSATPTPTGALTPTPTGTLSCTDLHILGGTTSRPIGQQIEFECQGVPTAQIKNCRFRFGDGSAEAFDVDCKVSHSYASVGSYKTSCEVQDEGGFWRASSACEDTLQVVSGPTNTPGAQGSASPIPTVSQQQLPQAGGFGQTIGVVVIGLASIVLGLLLLL